MSIRLKLIIVFSSIIFLIGAGLFFYLDSYLRSVFTTEIKKGMRSVAEASEGSYFIFTESLKTRTIDWSSDGYIRDSVEKITSEKTSAPDKNRLISGLAAYFKDKKMPYDPAVIIVDILDKDGIVVVSSRPDRIGVNEGEEEMELGVVRFSEAIKAGFGETFITNVAVEKDESDKGMIHVTTRVFSSKRDSAGNLVPLPVVMLLHFEKVDELSSILSGDWQEKFGALTGKFFSSVYKSGEVYLISKDGLLLTSPAEGKENLVLSKKVSQFLMDSCFKEEKEIAEEYLNYDGVKVLGATMCIKRDNTILAVEVPSEEALAPLGKIRQNLVLGFLFSLLLAVLSGFLFSSTVLRALQSIVDTARKVSLNKFSERVAVKSKDEIGYLAGVFNEMLNRVEVFQIEAETKTKELAERAMATEKQNKSLEEGKKAMLNILEDARALESSLQNERDKSVSIIASISEGLFVVDGNYKIVLMNPAAEKLFGLRAKDCLGKNPMDIVSIFKGDELLSSEQRPVTRTLKKGESVFIGIEDNFYFQIPSGKRFPVAIATSPIRTKELTGAVIVFRDVTDDKLLDEAKSSFISIASHQLRTPLTSVRWYSEMLLDEDMGPLNKEQKEFANQVHEGALRLFQTIDTLLALSRLESGKLQQDLIKIDIKPFTEGILKDLEPLLREKNLDLSLEIPPDLPNVLMDRFMFREVVTNLVANSIRYTNMGGKIKVDFKKDGPSSPGGSKSENQILCSVSDNGIGIPDEDKSKIFARFYRANNAIRKVPDGSGLGLSLVKSFVEKWGGRIWFESKLGEGTTFYFTIPDKSVFKG